MCKCWEGYIQFVELAQRKQNELVRKNYQQADSYYQYRLCESAIRIWNQNAIHVHTILFNTVQRIRIYYQYRGVLESWKSKAAYQKLKFTRLNQKAQRRGRISTLKWIMRRWNKVVMMIRRQHIDEECVAEKWREVKEWIMHL